MHGGVCNFCKQKHLILQTKSNSEYLKMALSLQNEQKEHLNYIITQSTSGEDSKNIKFGVNKCFLFQF